MVVVFIYSYILISMQTSYRCFDDGLGGWGAQYGSSCLLIHFPKEVLGVYPRTKTFFTVCKRNWSFVLNRDAGEQGHDVAFPPCLFNRGATGRMCLYHNSITGKFMDYQKWIQTFIAAIRAPRKFRMVFYNFEVNIVAEQKQSYW